MDSLSRGLKWLVLTSVLVVSAAGCIGVSPEQQLANELGPDPGPYSRGPLHRAGFPCTNCHGDLWWQDHPTFELAGTVYKTPTDDSGSHGSQVIIEDAKGQKITAQTNAVGNFFLLQNGMSVGRGGGGGGNDGSTVITAGLTFPLRVSVKTGAVEQKMRGLIWRERSCANCHNKQLGAASNGRVFAAENSP